VRIWIDADAAPREAKEIVFRAALRLRIETVLVANSRMPIPRAAQPVVSAVQVEGGADVADRYIAEHAEAGDVVITQDIPLAAQLVPRQIAVIDPRGDEHTENTIGERLSVRDLMDTLRGAGMTTGGPPAYDARDKQVFASTLDRTLTRLLRAASE
jgi:uncharacterized protein YaiI (UPF0178 family)